MARKLAVSMIALLFTLAACGTKGGGGSGGQAGTNPCGAGAVCGEVALSLDAVKAARPSGLRAAALRSARDQVSLDWQSGGIISGPPDGLRLYVKSISAAPADGGELVPIFQSTEARGTLIELTAGEVNLAAALGADAFQLPLGSYARLELEASRVADMKGCVSGKFISTTPETGRAADVSPGWALSAPLHADNVYSNDPITDGLDHTFCTRSGPNEVTVGTFTTDPIGSNADFESSSTSEWTEIDLALDDVGNQGADARRAASVTVASPAAFTVEAGAATPLTLAMDLNRMLRYFANTRADLLPPNPDMKAGTSYFFTTVFPFSTVLVPGSGGSIEGYRLTVLASSSGGGTGLVPGWLTVLRAAGGAVVGGVLMGDDDNGLTVAKGNLDAVASDDGEGAWTLGYGLGSGDGGEPFSGQLDGFTFTALGAAGDCALTITNAPWLSQYSAFHAYYSREL